MAVEVIRNAVTNLCAKAKMMNANAVINIELGSVARGEAIIAESFPDQFTEEDFEDFKGPNKFSGSEIFNCDYNTVFNAVVEVLENELYDVVKEEYSNGLIETEPIEVPNGKFAKDLAKMWEGHIQF